MTKPTTNPSNKRGRRSVSIALTLTLLCKTAWAACPFHSSSWISYDQPDETTIAQYAGQFDSLFVYAYIFDQHDNIIPGTPWVTSTLATYKAQNASGRRPVFFNLVNYVQGQAQKHDADLAYRILSDSGKRSLLISQIVAASSQADGVEIDFEAMQGGTTRAFFTTFIQELRAALPAGKLLACDLQPKTSNTIGNQGQAIDWAGIEPYVDMMKVLAYYYSYSTSPPGPTVSLAQLHDLTAYALTDPSQKIPASKLQIVLSLYGWNWPLVLNGTGVLIDYQSAITLANAAHVTPTRDPVNGDLHFNYTDAGGTAHEVWIDDHVSLVPKFQLVQNMGVSHIDVWRLASGDPQFWQWLSTSITNVPSGAAVLSELTPDHALAGGPNLNVQMSGQNFTCLSEVEWNGLLRPTVYNSETSLTVAISSSDIESPGVFPMAVMDSRILSNTKNFTVFGLPPSKGASSGLIAPSVFPNPWTSDKDNGAPITFAHVAPGSSIKIYTVSARWVKTLQAPDGTAHWDLTNDQGESVASGYYLYLLTDQAGNRSRGKLAIVK